MMSSIFTSRPIDSVEWSYGMAVVMMSLGGLASVGGHARCYEPNDLGDRTHAAIGGQGGPLFIAPGFPYNFLDWNLDWKWNGISPSITQDFMPSAGITLSLLSSRWAGPSAASHALSEMLNVGSAFQVENDADGARYFLF